MPPTAGDRPLFLISVAAELAGMHPQTLREYDRLGLVSPSRARGRGRRYSANDIIQLREVQRLSQEEGVNLAGIKRILELERMLKVAQQEIEQLRFVAEPGRHRIFAASASGDVVVTTRGRTQLVHDPEGRALVLWRPRPSGGAAAGDRR